jgi:hypothetical protein
MWPIVSEPEVTDVVIVEDDGRESKLHLRYSGKLYWMGEGKEQQQDIQCPSTL